MSQRTTDAQDPEPKRNAKLQNRIIMEQAFDLKGTEYLCVERDKVIDLYDTMDKAFPREAAYSVQSALQTLFGDKCLPDKEEISATPDKNVVEIAEETKDNMEEKELNHDEDFKMGDDVYLGTKLLGKFVCYSYSEYHKEVMVDVLIDSGKDREVNQGGWFAKDVSKMPQKPKRWRAKEGEEFYSILIGGEISRMTSIYPGYGDNLYNTGNYFRTEKEAQQAAEGIREYLKTFHENNPQ